MYCFIKHLAIVQLCGRQRGQELLKAVRRRAIGQLIHLCNEE